MYCIYCIFMTQLQAAVSHWLKLQRLTFRLKDSVHVDILNDGTS